MIQTSRRSFLGALLAAPVIVRAGSIMPVKAPVLEFTEQNLLHLNPTKLIIQPWMVEYTAKLIEAAKQAPIDSNPFPGATLVSR